MKKNPPTARPIREIPTDGGDGAARRGATGRQDAERVTEDGASGAGYLPAHFTGAAEATTESDARQRREYRKEAAASVGGLSRAGPAPAKDSHGATGYGKPQREEGENETPRSVREERETADRETEERGPPERSCVPNTSG